MDSTSVRRDLTLVRMGILVFVLFALLAAADLWRGRGGSAWIHGGRAVAVEADPATGALYFDDVRLFDGLEVVASTDVLVAEGVIQAIGDGDPPAGAEVIDGAGRTLMPGMIDAHSHVFGPVLRTAAVLGVTTTLDMFTEPNGAAVLRDEQERDGALDRADLFSAGVLATAPGGHGTEYGLEIPTLTTPEEAPGWVRARIEEGSDYIKIVRDGGSLSREFNTLDLPTIAALIEAAHDEGLLAVVHVSTVEDARAVVEAGADGIVHVFYDRPADDEIVEVLAAHGAFVVPTLSVLESVSGLPGGAELLDDERLLRYLSADARNGLGNGFPPAPGRAQVLANGLASVAALHAAGVPILAGTDAPNPGTWHGASMHREIMLLERAGLSAVEALAAATATPAREFRLEDRGRIAVGRRADLVLVQGDPTTVVTAARDIVGVWKMGSRLDRDATAEAVAASLEPAAAVELTADGLVTGFESGEVDSAFGSGWSYSTDTMAGGRSSGDMAVVDGGAAGTARSLQISGELVPNGPATWSGPMFFAGTPQFAPADYSAYSGIAFYVRGDGATHAIMGFATSLGQIPSIQTFETSEEWTEVRISFDRFQGLDPAGLQAIMFSGAGSGAFRFQIDEFRFW